MQVLILLKIIYLGIIWEECSNSVHLVFDHDYPKPTVTVTRQKQHWSLTAGVESMENPTTMKDKF